jgi:hypothetical protein
MDLTLIDSTLPMFDVVGLEAAAEQTVAAAESVAADQAAAEATAEAASEAAIKAATADVAAAEIEAAIEQVAACVAAEHAEAIGAAVEELVAAVEQAETRRLRLERRLAHEIAPDRDFIDEARARPSPRNENACFICMNSDLPTDSYMPCCRHHVHRACIARWHGMGQNKTKNQVKTPKQDGGWKPVAMARLHECPHCSAEMLSARVPML